MTEDLMAGLFKVNEQEIHEMYRQREEEIEFILRNKIDRPIKGEITKNKLRWRGIKSLCFRPGHTFLGIIQRGKIITKDGIYEPIAWPQVKTKLKFTD